MSILASRSGVAVCAPRGVVMEPTEVKVLEEGSKSWAEATGRPRSSRPPAIRTVPSATSVAVWPQTGVGTAAEIGVYCPVDGSKISASDKAWPEASLPPAIRTEPFASSVAVCPARAWVRFATGRQVPGSGSSCAPEGGAMPGGGVARGGARGGSIPLVGGGERVPAGGEGAKDQKAARRAGHGLTERAAVDEGAGPAIDGHREAHHARRGRL